MSKEIKEALRGIPKEAKSMKEFFLDSQPVKKLTDNPEEHEYKHPQFNPSSPIDLSRGSQALPRGMLEQYIYRNYYDINNTITNALSTPTSSASNDPDDPNYNRERINVVLERNAEKLWVTNDAPTGGAPLFTIISHDGEMHWSQERPIYPQETKVYYNVYEIRLRSPVAGSLYRVTEYEIMMP